MDYTLIFNPIVTPAIVALTTSAAMLWAIIGNRATITGTFKQIREKVWTRAGFFWAVNLVFMAVSVLHAGTFFGITGNGHGMPGMGQILGFAVSFFLDLVTIILMQAMLEARYRGDEGRANQFLFFIIVCCATSTFANLAISLNDFDAKVMLPNVPWPVQVAAPYVLASFPLFVIMMSIAAEMIINIRPMDQLDEEEYEADEKKRIKMLEIRNTYLKRQADEELRALTIRAQMKTNKLLRSGKTPNGFRWFWEKSVDVDTIIAGVTSQLKALYEPEIEQLKKRLEVTNATSNTTTSSQAFYQIDNTYNHRATSQSQSGITHEIKGEDEESIQSSINSIPATLDVASLDLSPDVAEVVQRYPNVYIQWLSQGVKSVSIEEIVTVTGQSKRRIAYQIGKALKQSSRNEQLILVSSIMAWLKTAPMPANKEAHTDPIPVISTSSNTHQSGEIGGLKETINLNEYVDNEMDKISVTLAAMRSNPAITDEELATILGLERPAMARFWKLKAQALLEQEQQLVEESAECVAV